MKLLSVFHYNSTTKVKIKLPLRLATFPRMHNWVGVGFEGIDAGRKVVTSLYHNIRCLLNIFTVNIIFLTYLILVFLFICRSQGPRGLRRGSGGRLLVGIVGSNPTGGMGFDTCVCCVLSGRGLSVGLITRPEECYRV